MNPVEIPLMYDEEQQGNSSPSIPRSRRMNFKNFRTIDDDLKIEKKKKVVVEVLRALSAEFVGTFFLILIGVGTSVSEHPVEGDQRLRFAMNAIVMGSITVVMNYCLTVQSGSIFNPAVTFALMLIRRLSVLRGIAYISAQIMGSICGAFVIKFIIPPTWVPYMNDTVTTMIITPLQAVAVESLVTMVVVTVVLFLGVSDEVNHGDTVKPFITGLAIIACDIFAAPLTGSSHNPSRTLGPAIVSNIWTNHWVYWIGPLIGSFVATFFYILHHTSEYFGTISSPYK